MRRGKAPLLLLLSLLIVAACSSGPTPTPTLRPGETPQPTPTVTPRPGETPLPTATPTPLPSQQVTFRVHAPETPDNNPVHLLLKPAVDYATLERIEMQRDGDAWTATASLPRNGLVHYVYDRFVEGEPFDGFKAKREAHGPSTLIESRLLLVTPSLGAVEDTIETWADDRRDPPTGTLTGQVLDEATGDPIVDADVTAGGIHIATDFEGRFSFDRLAAGNQRVLAHTALGDYVPIQTSTEVTANAESLVTLRMRKAQPVTLTFDITLPPDTPPDAEVRIVGNVVQLGAMPLFPNQPRMAQDWSIPALERVSPTRARGTFNLHEGTYLHYYYTLTSTFNAREHDSDDQQVYRDLTVSPSSSTVSDGVHSWMSEHQRMVELRITTPPDTDGFVGVSVGPTHIAAHAGDNEYVTYFTGFPGNIVTYRLTEADTHEGTDASPGISPDGNRTLTIGQTDSIERVTVHRWGSHRQTTAVAPETLIDVPFQVALPDDTPTDAAVTVESASQSFPLSHVSGGPFWQGTVRAPAGSTLAYHVRADGQRGPDRTAAIVYRGQVIHDWVTAWQGTPLPATRPDYIAGVYTPDYWTDTFQRLTDDTYERIAVHNGNWVALSSIWHYGQILPEPTVESRSVYAPAVLTPRPDIVEQARKAKAAGLKTLLAPQFNMEMVPGYGEQLNHIVSDAWWDAWYETAEELWMWHAQLADEIDADALLLPGYVFHVFSGPGRFESPEAFEAFDAKLADLVARVRDVYAGKLLISGGVLESDLPGHADLVGVTTYDTGHPELPASATVDEWHAAYDALFQQVLDPKWERWGVPVLFYTINVPAPNGGVDDEEAQARQLEGIMRAVDDRPWVAGSFMWAYRYVNQPIADNGLRGRLGEAVMAKNYGELIGQP